VNSPFVRGNINKFKANLNGKLVKRLVSGSMKAGRHSVVWDGTDAHGVRVASGVYLYKLEASGFVAQRKLVLMKQEV
jgi:flagellar hook assembly protein FlgD